MFHRRYCKRLPRSATKHDRGRGNPGEDIEISTHTSWKAAFWSWSSTEMLVFPGEYKYVYNYE